LNADTPIGDLIDGLERLDNELGDGGDSDDDGEEVEIHDEALARSVVDRHNHDSSLAVDQNTCGNIGFVLTKAEVNDIEDEVEVLRTVPKPPADWIRPSKKCKDEIEFNLVDNPGNWPDFIFRPCYSKREARKPPKYIRHELPTGATPVPADGDGKRVCNEWEFFYQGWKDSVETSTRSGATVGNLFPENRKSKLDVNLLKKLGLNSQRISSRMTGEPDSLFFHQLILPMCDTSKSGIDADPRKSFYFKVATFSNLYKHQLGIGNGYGHNIPEVSIAECLRYDGCVYRDGVRGGGDGALYRRWQEASSCSDEFIQRSMSLHRWYQIKRIYKLCNNDTSKKRGEDGYDPAYKYDMIFDTIVSNVIALTESADLDLTGDETTWGHQGFGEKGSNIVSRIMGKPGITKGGQISLICASNRIRPYAYRHRHNCHAKYDEPGFNAQGPSEVRALVEELSRHVVGKEGNARKIFSEGPHMTFDNHFSGVEVMKYVGRRGFGMTCTTRRDRLPPGVPSMYYHKNKTGTDHRTKVARFVNPIVAVNTCDGFKIVLTSFQSTSSCNIMSVNGISECRSFVEARGRGKNNSRRVYVIEQNMARLLYLKTYSRIDSIDHLIRNCKISYRCWKYWHSPANHGKSLAVVIAYDMYLECCEGELDESWKVKDPVDFHTFRDILSKQMCRYDPKGQQYPGDEMMRNVTVLNKKRKAAASKRAANGEGYVSYEQYESEVKKGRICLTLEEYEVHLSSITKTKHEVCCAVCGKACYKKCGECGVSLHHFDNRGHGKDMKCHYQWHNQKYLGLTFKDRTLIGVVTKEWSMWNDGELAENEALMQNYCAMSNGE